MSYRVDNIPLLIRPFFYIYSYTLALLTYVGMFGLLRLLCTIKVEGEELPAGQRNAIYCIWHEALILYFTVYMKYRQPYAWMNHPAWFMKPIHIILGFMGLKHLVLGSSGNRGRDAMEKVAAYVAEGYNTMLAVDGPAGPYKDLKYGVLEMSKITGVPVIPISFHLNHYFRLGRWDKKLVPWPFSTFTIKYHPPIQVTAENYEEAREYIRQCMG